ncbi:MAG: hypothetical protein Q9167_002797 [Letrouitia subvulpina]
MTSTNYGLEVEKILKNLVESAGVKLRSGAKALDVVQAVVVSLKDCPLFNAGKGAILNLNGEHELEAAIVDGQSGSYGAVAATRNIKNPIEAARAVIENARHSFLVGLEADEFARTSGVTMVSNDYFTTASEKARWRTRTGNPPAPSEDLETVGAVALDIFGDLAAASFTGGLIGKMKGRFSESGELDLDISVARLLTSHFGSGVGEDILPHSIAGKVAALNTTGYLNDAMAQAIAVPTRPKRRPPLHVIYENELAVIGLTRYPITDGHTAAVCRKKDELMSLPMPTFVKVMHLVRQITAALNAYFGTSRCGLSSDGGPVVYLTPLHGLGSDWEPVIHNREEYHARFPGYLSSKNGPKMTDTALEETLDRITATTGIKKPYDTHFNGDVSDQDLFARIIRGEISQWRIWEDAAFVAFLTPFGNTPGFTVLVPRKHLGSDIFKLDDNAFTDMIQAAYKVAQCLKKAFNIRRCGMFFEGFEVDYAHVKLVPVHDQFTPKDRLFTPISTPAAFQKKYEGFLTTQSGPPAQDPESIADNAKRLRELHAQENRVIAPMSN